ncbi:MAG: MBL fold metallo-hydrolase [Actinobacteria bacterium]|nr:MBL fold metallo-hydrolase [Actinomycetota bacterium]
MIENIHWLGHDSFRLDGSSTVYIDPWKLCAEAPPADLILVTHDHFDHFSPDDIARVVTPRTTLIGPASVTDQVDGVTALTLGAGETATVGGVTVTAVPAYNIDKFRRPGEVFHPPAAGGLGYIVELDGRRIYHAGDTDAIPEMRGVRCDVALLPVSGTYVMTAEEAAEACRMISATAVVPMHFGDIVGTAADAARFESLCGVPVTVLPLEEG